VIQARTPNRAGDVDDELRPRSGGCTSRRPKRGNRTRAAALRNVQEQDRGDGDRCAAEEKAPMLHAAIVAAEGIRERAV
jgi:hypothetical protein